MTLTCNCVTHELDCIDAARPLTRVMNGSSCVDIGLLVEDSNTLDLTAGANLTMEAILSADSSNTIEILADGLYVPNPYICGTSGSTNEDWTETSASDTLRQSLTLDLLDGTWFVLVWWSAWIRKSTQIAGTTSLNHRLRVDGTDGPQVSWNARDMEGIIIRPLGGVSLTDVWGRQVTGPGTITVGIVTSIGSAGANNEVDVFNSRVNSVAILRP